MPDPPSLPDAPLASDGSGDAARRAERLRRCALIVAMLLLSAAVLGQLAALVYVGGAVDAGSRYAAFQAFAVVSPSVLIGVIGLHLASGSPPQAGRTAAYASIMASASAVAHGWLLAHYSWNAYTVSRSMLGLVGDGLVLGLPVTRRLAAATPIIAGTIAGLAVSPCIFTAQAVFMLQTVLVSPPLR